MCVVVRELGICCELSFSDVCFYFSTKQNKQMCICEIYFYIFLVCIAKYIKNELWFFLEEEGGDQSAGEEGWTFTRIWEQVVQHLLNNQPKNTTVPTIHFLVLSSMIIINHGKNKVTIYEGIVSIRDN